MWFTEYTIDEPFPETDIRGTPSTEVELINRSGVVYPKHPIGLNFPVTDVNKAMFWEAKNGDYWILIRGLIRYRDIFESEWDNYFCFIYDPTRYKKGIGIVACLQYAKEERASKGRPPAPQRPPLVLPELPESKL